MKHVVIDSNIYLRFYAYSEDTLEELEKLKALAEAGQISLYLPHQIMDEVSRNRELEISRAIEKFQRSASPAEVPRFAASSNEAKELIQASKQVALAKSALSKKIGDDIAAGELRADNLIYELSTLASKLDTAVEHIERARLRREVGNPPGKPDTLGDQIIWEVLLDKIAAATDLHFITDDRDYLSALDDTKPSDPVAHEWNQKNGGQFFVYKSLSKFAKEHFPDIKLPADVIKSDAISKLAQSGNFSWTHIQIARLEEVFDQLTLEDAVLIFQAMIDNSQVNWIASDPDVESFYSKLFEKYSASLSEEIKEKLEMAAPYLSDVPF